MSGIFIRLNLNGPQEEISTRELPYIELFVLRRGGFINRIMTSQY